MTIREFLDHSGISISEFSRAMEVSRHTMYAIVSGKNKPSLDLAYKIIMQSGYNVALEDLISPTEWKPRKMKTGKKFTIQGAKLKKHERRQYFKDIDNI